MSSINELIRRVEALRPPPPDDLLNKDFPCECGVCGCKSPMLVPRSQL